MSYELKIALRFLRYGKAQTALILLGIAIGVAVMLFLGSLITSLQDSLVQKTIGNSSHLTITAEGDAVSQLLLKEESNTVFLRGNEARIETKLNEWSALAKELAENPAVLHVSPIVTGTALVQDGGSSRSVLLKGVDAQNADPIYQIASRMTQGEYALSGNRVLIGTTLAEELECEAGDALAMLTPSGETVRFLIGGIFDLENEAANSTYVFLDLNRAQSLFDYGNGVTAIETQLVEPFQADAVAEDLRLQYTDVTIEEWKTQNQQLLSALASQSSSSYTIQFFVILAVTLGISSVLAISVVQKSKEIGILKAMGATRRSASKIFLMQGLLLGMLGSLVGVGLGLLLIEAFQAGTSGSSDLVITMQPGTALLIAVISTLASALASLLPARRSANLNPMEAIKNG